MTLPTQELVERVDYVVKMARQYEAAVSRVPEFAKDAGKRLEQAKRELLASLPTAQAADQWRGIAERYEKALRDIADGDVPKISAEKWRKDGEPSKYDKCPHDRWLYEDCDPCIEDFARAALPPPPAGEKA